MSEVHELKQRIDWLQGQLTDRDHDRDIIRARLDQIERDVGGVLGVLREMNNNQKLYIEAIERMTIRLSEFFVKALEARQPAPPLPLWSGLFAGATSKAPTPRWQGKFKPRVVNDTNPPAA